MNTSSTRRRQIVASLQDKDYREAFVAAEISTTVPFQIRELRNARGWTQTQLADQTGQEQGTISRFEDPDYATFSVTSLKRLASAFDVALIVRFVPFSELVDRTIVKESLLVPEYADDVGLQATTAENIVVATGQTAGQTAVTFPMSFADFSDASGRVARTVDVDDRQGTPQPKDTELANAA